jgi:ATP-binding cassette subfamily C protein/ATP-binding cassette subfamily C exporter for protease/lipase/ATP-binding cassette subfamily C protein EexD
MPSLKDPRTEKATALTSALRSCRSALRVCVVFSLVINVLMIAQPIYMLQIYDRVLTTGHVATLIMITLITAVAIAVMSALDALRTAVTTRIGCWLNDQLGPVYIACGVRGRLHGASTSAQALHDISQIQSFISNQGLTAFFDSPWVPIFIAMIWLLHPMLGAVSALSAIILLCLGIANEIATRSRAAVASTAQIEATNLADATIRNAEVVRAMNMLPALINRWAVLNDDANEGLRIAGDAAAVIMGITRFTRFFVQVAILGLGAWLVLDAQLTPGGMIAASILLGRALAPVELAIGAGRNFINARLAYARLKKQIEDYPPEAERTRLPEPLGSLVVEDVSFRAPNTEHVILRSVSFSVEPGEVLAIVGPSGGGKSTLCRLLVGINTPTLGEIKLDGSSLQHWDPAQLASNIGYLPQDVELFNGSVAENIARMQVSADRDVLNAAIAANAHSMIQNLPDGYDTQIGRSGVRLSGGQRQRVGLSRAIYGKPRLVVLDEPNANLDQSGETALVNTLSCLKKLGIALIIVGHRASTLTQADKILVLKEGCVAVFGKRTEVLQILAKAGSQNAGNEDSDANRKPAAASDGSVVASHEHSKLEAIAS